MKTKKYSNKNNSKDTECVIVMLLMSSCYILLVITEANKKCQ